MAPWLYGTLGILQAVAVAKFDSTLTQLVNTAQWGINLGWELKLIVPQIGLSPLYKYKVITHMGLSYPLDMNLLPLSIAKMGALPLHMVITKICLFPLHIVKSMVSLSPFYTVITKMGLSPLNLVITEKSLVPLNLVITSQLETA